MPAKRRINRALKREKSQKSKNKIKPLLIVAVVIFLGLTSWLLIERNHFTGEDKLSLAVQRRTGDVSLLIFDFERREIVKINLPGTVEVESARNRGKFKLKNIWELGENESVGGGKFLTETLTGYFKFPTYVWATEGAINFNGGNPFACYRAAFSVYGTNLSLGDKIALANFCTQVKNIDRTEINLADSTFLRKSTLADGESGYVVTNLPSPKLYSNFIYPTLAGGNYKVSIIDGSENGQATKFAGEILEVVGPKVSSFANSASKEDIMCRVKSASKDVSGKIAKILGCTVDPQKTDDPKLVEVLIGKKFEEIY